MGYVDVNYTDCWVFQFAALHQAYYVLNLGVLWSGMCDVLLRPRLWG